MSQCELLEKIEFEKPYTLIELTQLNGTTSTCTIRNLTKIKKYRNAYGVEVNEEWTHFKKTSIYAMSDLEVTRDYKKKLYTFRRNTNGTDRRGET